MATWTTIPDSSLEPGKPIRSIDTLALRDNPVAIAEGAAGAPRILSFAFETLEAGDVIRSRSDFENSTSSTAYQPLESFGFIQYGTVRFSVELRNSGGTVVASYQIRRTRNNVTSTLATLTNNTSSYVTRTADVSVEMGDKIETFMASSSTTVSIYVRNRRLLTSGAKWWPATSGAVE